MWHKKMLFVMDPLASIIPDHDSSYAMMKGAHKAGHEVLFCPMSAVSLVNEQVHFAAELVVPEPSGDLAVTVIKPVSIYSQDLDAVFIRPDPPFDEQYLALTWKLEHCGCFVMNRPSGLRTVNEKLWCLKYTDCVPTTLVSSNLSQLRDFVIKQGKIVAKPANSFGGQGVFILDANSKNMNVTLETLSNMGEQDIILQEYLSEAEAGDKRILLLNGETLGAVMRVHSNVDHRNNFFAGGRAEKASITAHDQKIIDTLKPDLQALGLYFVGIDIIGDKLIEVNVTSPTCIQEINRLDGVNLEQQIIAFVESQI